MSLVITVPERITPDNSVGLSLTTSVGDMTTPGPWVEFIASAAAEVTIAGLFTIVNTGAVGSGVHIAYQYGVGGSGSEVALNDWQFSADNSANGVPSVGHDLEIPIGPIATGSRICVRIKSNKIISSSNCTGVLRYFESYDSAHRTLKKETFAPANSGGSAITPSGTAFNPSAWVEFIPSLVDDGVLIGISVSQYLGDTENIFEVGFGAASSEVVVTTIRVGASGSSPIANFDLPAPLPIPAGTRVSLRLRKSGTSTSTYTATLRYIGDITIEPTLQKVTQQVVLVWYNAAADEPATVDPCVGGGTVPTSSDPSAGEDLSAATAPIPWIAITIGGTVYRYAAATIPHTPQRYGRVLSFGEIDRPLSEPDAGPKAATMSVSLADTDRVLRGLANAGTLKHALYEAFISDLPTIIAGGTPFRVFRGRVSSWKAEAGLGFTINAEDELTARLTSIDAQDQQVGLTLLDRISDDNPAERLKGKPAPEVYGSMSDEDEDEPQGAYELKYGGSFTFHEDESLGNNHVFPVCVGAVGQVQSALAGNSFEDPPVTRVYIPDSAWGVWAWTPKKPGWFMPEDYYEDPSTLQRWTIVILKDGHPVAEMARSGRIPLTVNVCGYETVGDASGNTINSIPRGMLHWINARLLQDGCTSDWPTSIFALGDHSAIYTPSFEAAHDQLDALGYLLGGVLGINLEFESWRDRWAVWLRHLGYGSATGANRHGQILLARLDRTEDYSDAPTIGPDTILEDGCEVDNRDDAVENVIRYVSKQNNRTKLQGLNPAEGERGLREPYDGPWLYLPEPIQDSTSITALGGDPRGKRRSEIQEYSLTRDEDTADALAAERLDWLKPANGRAEITFPLSLKHAVSLELGDVVQLEHWDLPWTGTRRCWVRGLRLNLDTLAVTVRVWDVDDLLP